MTQKCYKCKLEKPMSEFGADSTRKSGRKSSCKICAAEMASAARKKKAWDRNPHKIKAPPELIESINIATFGNIDGFCERNGLHPKHIYEIKRGRKMVFKTFDKICTAVNRPDIASMYMPTHEKP